MKLESLILDKLKKGESPENISQEFCNFFLKHNIIKTETEEYFTLLETFTETAHLLKIRHLAATKYKN